MISTVAYLWTVFLKAVSAKCNKEKVKFKTNEATTSSDVKTDIQNHILSLIFNGLQYL